MLDIIPRPFAQQKTGGNPFVFSGLNKWAGEGFDRHELEFWRQRFMGLLSQPAETGQANQIVLRLDPVAVPGVVSQAGGSLEAAESYSLAIAEDTVTITAPQKAGLVWGLQTLYLLMVPEAGKERISIQAQSIEDAPSFTHRGFMLDVARHFYPVETVKRLLDAMSLLKLNRFHWHLTDEQGWRIEIRRYPRLTSIGSVRRETRGDGVEHRGYYTQQDIKEVVRHAEILGIEIIPEIDLPGHFGAAIAAYPELSCRKEPAEVLTTFGIFPDIACAGDEATYTFMENVLEEICELFPGQFIHLGGDEAPKDRWRECPKCQSRKAQLGLLKTSHLQRYMLNRLTGFLAARGKSAIAWNDGVSMGGIDNSVAMQYWIGGKAREGSAQEMNSGRGTIISNIGNYYFDYPYGMTSLRKAYGAIPLPKGAGADVHLLGIEAALWTEYVSTEARLHHLLFPRLAAVAERAWRMLGDDDYQGFTARLGMLEAALKRFGITGATLREAEISGLAARMQVLRFFRNMFRGFKFKMLRTVLQLALAKDED